MRGARSFNGPWAPSQNLHSPACLLPLGQAPQRPRTLYLRLGAKSCRRRMLMARSSNSGDRPFPDLQELLSCSCLHPGKAERAFMRVPVGLYCTPFWAAGLRLSWMEIIHGSPVHVSKVSTMSSLANCVAIHVEVSSGSIRR